MNKYYKIITKDNEEEIISINSKEIKSLNNIERLKFPYEFNKAYGKEKVISDNIMKIIKEVSINNNFLRVLDESDLVLIKEYNKSEYSIIKIRFKYQEPILEEQYKELIEKSNYPIIMTKKNLLNNMFI